MIDQRFKLTRRNLELKICYDFATKLHYRLYPANMFCQGDPVKKVKLKDDGFLEAQHPLLDYEEQLWHMLLTCS